MTPRAPLTYKIYSNLHFNFDINYHNSNSNTNTKLSQILCNFILKEEAVRVFFNKPYHPSSAPTQNVRAQPACGCGSPSDVQHLQNTFIHVYTYIFIYICVCVCGGGGYSCVNHCTQTCINIWHIKLQPESLRFQPSITSTCINYQ